MEKLITRNCAKFIRSKLNMQSISSELVKQIRSLGEYKTSKMIMLYYPKSEELDLTPLALDDKNFCLPRLEKGCICPCKWCAEDELVLSNYNILEPKTPEIPAESIDLIIMPGLCADINKNRIGYGKGCYDYFLARCSAKTIFPVPDELLFNNIPSTPLDIKPDIIITPTRIIK